MLTQNQMTRIISSTIYDARIESPKRCKAVNAFVVGAVSVDADQRFFLVPSSRVKHHCYIVVWSYEARQYQCSCGHPGMHRHISDVNEHIAAKRPSYTAQAEREAAERAKLAMQAEREATEQALLTAMRDAYQDVVQEATQTCMAEMMDRANETAHIITDEAARRGDLCYREVMRQSGDAMYGVKIVEDPMKAYEVCECCLHFFKPQYEGQSHCGKC